MFTLTHDCHNIRYFFDFIELMGNDDDCLAIIAHRTDDIKQFLCFLRCQYGSRFIENQYIRTTVENFQDFYRLLLRYGHIIDFLVRINFKTIAVRNCLYLFRQFPTIQSSLFLQSKDNVFSSRKYINQFEMLMNHTDLMGICILWRSDADRFPVDQNFAFIRKVDASQHVHQGCLAGAVFPKQ